MRIIVISEGLPESSPFLQELIQADIQNVVIAEKIDMIQDELRECFSEAGMLLRNPAEKSSLLEVIDQPPSVGEITQFNFNCTNVTIAIAGSDRRVGVTTTAFNLVCLIVECLANVFKRTFSRQTFDFYVGLQCPMIWPDFFEL